MLGNISKLSLSLNTQLFLDASQTLRSECDVTPELLKQTLSMRKHKHLHSGSNGETMCRCVRMRNEVREKSKVRFYAKQKSRLRRRCQKADSLCDYAPSPHLSSCVAGFTFSSGDHREKEDMYDEIMRLKKVKVK